MRRFLHLPLVQQLTNVVSLQRRCEWTNVVPKPEYEIDDWGQVNKHHQTNGERGYFQPIPAYYVIHQTIPCADSGKIF